jgi:hypothetical protein
MSERHCLRCCIWSICASFEVPAQLLSTLVDLILGFVSRYLTSIFGARGISSLFSKTCDKNLNMN